ncbi:MraY family glycosyltransferase [Azospirillum picis]|uniref:UDP-GlcNAc:undecaprenyl-phosphate GlcNAc-1-phosphate transferase n=1 Tax=Azospirillum picis TaxID=488438 RepID=A0ABU0MRL5_9PROT|nr:MraY family glycosyltransferase [Azospirillum picis]MBP2300866.1 UDP-GlcNAc:undecaprenyl-phosphate GlcNAc-1-phosphate transferase [Azospirillum picis]MDQ0536123.1 UDP-GlcNAc:undecaprenyl-phosphate GlcNAc-1-phosphate transferase [Azospirillum picis]
MMTLPMMILLNSFLICVGMIACLQRLAPRLGLLDIPSGRKQHEEAVPMVGGIAIFVALTLSILLGPKFEGALVPFFTGVALLVALGVIDDRNGMDARTKLLGQIVATLVMIMPDQTTTVAHLGDLLGWGAIALEGAAVPLTVLFVVASINAFNMIDGLDGVAGGVAGVGLLWLAAVAVLEGRMELMTLALTLACAISGFLLFNLRHRWRSRAEVFLGDAGSMMVGAILAFLAVRLSQGPEGVAAAPAALLWTVALPGIDMVSVTARRIARRRSPFAADRIHLHHVLLDCGFSPCAVTFLLIALAFLLGGCGLLGVALRIPDYLMFWGLALPMAAHSWFVLAGWKGVRLPARSTIALRERVS